MTGNRRELGGSVALGRGTCAGPSTARCSSPAAGSSGRRGIATRALRAAVAPGVDHIDTAQYYGAGTVNEQKTGGRRSE